MAMSRFSLSHFKNSKIRIIVTVTLLLFSFIAKSLLEATKKLWLVIFWDRARSGNVAEDAGPDPTDGES